jgi:cytochrome c
MRDRTRLAIFLTLTALPARFLLAQSGAGDTTAGQVAFERRCTGCHALDHDKVGPRLAGVVGRKAGKAPSFTYSEALKNTELVWDEQLLDKWLTDPDSVIPDTDMSFRLNNAAERAEIIAFLKEKR